MVNMELIKKGDIVVFEGDAAPHVGIVYDIENCDLGIYRLGFQDIVGRFFYDNKGATDISHKNYNIIAFSTPKMIIEMLEHRMIEEYNMKCKTQRIRDTEILNKILKDEPAEQYKINERETNKEIKRKYDESLKEFIKTLSEHHSDIYKMVENEIESHSYEGILQQAHFHRGFICALQIIQDKINND